MYYSSVISSGHTHPQPYTQIGCEISIQAGIRGKKSSKSIDHPPFSIPNIETKKKTIKLNERCGRPRSWISFD